MNGFAILTRDDIRDLVARNPCALGAKLDEVRASDPTLADVQAHRMLIAALTYFHVTRGPMVCAEYCDMLAHDYTAEVLGHRRTTR